MYARKELPTILEGRKDISGTLVDNGTTRTHNATSSKEKVTNLDPFR